MNDPKDPLLLDHEYDGIHELDNNLPRWWVWLFNLSIAFALVYTVYYHVLGKGDLMAAEYAREMEIGNKIKLATLAKFEQEMPSLQPSSDNTLLADGERIYQTLCAPCHRLDAGGLVGPNLTDDFWIHGAEFKDSLKTIYDGVPDKGMLTWKGVLTPREIHAVASYIFTKRGTNPPNPKPPESTAPAAGPSEYE